MLTTNKKIKLGNKTNNEMYTGRKQKKIKLGRKKINKQTKLERKKTNKKTNHQS